MVNLLIKKSKKTRKTSKIRSIYKKNHLNSYSKGYKYRVLIFINYNTLCQFINTKN